MNTQISSATGPTEDRLVDIQEKLRMVPARYELLGRALCEIALQLARLADAYEEAHK